MVVGKPTTGESKMRTWTYTLAMAAAKDAANSRMRKAGRKKWNVGDWNFMCETFDRLHGVPVIK